MVRLAATVLRGVPDLATRRGIQRRDVFVCGRARRLVKDLPGTTSDTLFAYDGWQVILEYSGETGLPLRQYVYGAFINEPIALDLADASGEFADGSGEPLTRYLYHQTPIYNVAALTDYWTGALVERYDYDPYGKYTLIEPDDTRTESGPSTVGNPMTFTGHWFDRETGNYYLRKRFYSHTYGCFLARDFVNSVFNNTYMYGLDNSIKYYDSYGMSPSSSLPPSIIHWVESKVSGTRSYAGMNGRTVKFKYKYTASFSVHSSKNCVLLIAKHINLIPDDDNVKVIPLTGWTKALNNTFSNKYSISTNCSLCKKNTIYIIFAVLFDKDGPYSDVHLRADKDSSKESSDYTHWDMNDARIAKSPFDGFTHEMGHHYGLRDDYDNPLLDPHYIDTSVMGNSNTQSVKEFKREHFFFILDDIKKTELQSKMKNIDKDLTLEGEIKSIGK